MSTFLRRPEDKFDRTDLFPWQVNHTRHVDRSADQTKQDLWTGLLDHTRPVYRSAERTGPDLLVGLLDQTRPDNKWPVDKFAIEQIVLVA